ncbi:MAG: nitroreductase family protein [Acidobacteriaceae bacterium]
MPGILKLIRDRHSTRGSFDTSRPVTREQLKQVLEAARWAPTPNNMQNFEIVVVDEKEQIEAIGKIPAEMTEAFLRENYAQLSFTEEELLVKKSGMLASAFPAAWTDPEAWNPESDYRYQMTFLGRAVEETSLLLVVLYDGSKRAPGSERDVLGQIGLGCVLENMWLMSESLGIGFHVLTVFGDGRVEKEVKKVLHVPEPMKVAYACSLGHRATPQPDYPRVRRELESFIHHNRFGRKDIAWSAGQAKKPRGAAKKA